MEDILEDIHNLLLELRGVNVCVTNNNSSCLQSLDWTGEVVLG